jgi:predicted DCC family thiol-disulfide oxidoreductase YuxK
MTASAADRWQLVYDGACGFCRWITARILRIDRRGRLAPIALADPAIPRILAHLTPDERAASWHLVAPDGAVRSAGAAVPALLRLLPGGRLIAWLPAAAPRTTDRLYRWLARRRGTLGVWLGEERCEVVPGDDAGR